MGEMADDIVDSSVDGDSFMTVIAVWFSCGAASAAAARLTLDRYPDADVRVCYCPVVEEDADNLRFLSDCEVWLGKKIERVTNPSYPSCSAVEVWNRRRYMSGNRGAPCTLELKKEARRHWEKENKPDWHVLGFTAEEHRRHKWFTLGERSNVLPVLIDARMTKDDCFNLVRSAGIKLPRIYEMGYPNANCIGCVKASSPTYWNHVRAQHPEVFAGRAEQSRAIGAKLVRVCGKRMFLDELPVDATGRKLRKLPPAPECGIFCDPTRKVS